VGDRRLCGETACCGGCHGNEATRILFPAFDGPHVIRLVQEGKSHSVIATIKTLKEVD